MAFETRPTQQPKKHKEMLSVGGGKNKTKRISATTTVQTLTIPLKVNGVILKHASGNSVTITLDSGILQGWVVDAGDPYLKFPVTNVVDFKYRVVGDGASVGELYCMFY